ncbi:DUF4421 family protein [Flavobacterium agrisoli]|uniref:DUF4421 family protein n=1 Tax=Flavobacterium agrisoli TaxID=2793066 RepID=A0A934UK46_9FLAO|nr:DUF4421 family protein [Flavobacterium agrisoli]MBK0370562.1 DUF4421 family protein [Flavobacterium agrisoli]
MHLKNGIMGFEENRKFNLKRFQLKKTVFFWFFIFCHFIFHGQQKEKDTTHFVFYPDKIMVRANLNTQTDAHILNNKSGDNLYLQTNNSYKLFLAVDYKFIGFTYGFYPKFIGGNKDENTKGKSKFSEYNFRFFLGQWLQTVEYSKIKGYYVENSTDFFPGLDPDHQGYIVFPDFKTQRYGMSTSYIFNKNFSLKSITSFTEWQKKSAGSFIPTILYAYKKLSFSTDILESSQNEYDIAIGQGYFYNFIIKNRFYVAPNLTVLGGIKFTNSKSNEENVITTEKKNYWATALKGGLKIGYNSEKILCGLSFNFDATSYKENKTETISNDNFYGLLYFGYRFDAPKFIAKPVENIENKINF